LVVGAGCSRCSSFWLVILKAVRAKQELLAAEEEAVAKVQEAPVSANRGELAAVIASCIAEVLGREVTGLRIVSIKRVG
jgi:hypothetical protein